MAQVSAMVKGRSRIYSSIDVPTGPTRGIREGVIVAAWISSHHSALNVDPDLWYFGHIVPCDLHDKGVTSITGLIGRPVELIEAADRVEAHFARVFDFDVTAAPRSALLLGTRRSRQASRGGY